LGARERCGFPPTCRLKLPTASIGWKHFIFCCFRLRFLWFVGAITPVPNEDQVACHFPKPILLNTVRTRAAVLRGIRTIRGLLFVCLFKGYAHVPYDWSPSIVDIQMFRVGNLVILVIPGEMTTMGGRRIRYVRRPLYIFLQSYQKPSPIGPIVFF
jgi:hypothetical protein